MLALLWLVGVQSKCGQDLHSIIVRTNIKDFLYLQGDAC